MCIGLVGSTATAASDCSPFWRLTSTLGPTVKRPLTELLLLPAGGPPPLVLELPTVLLPPPVLPLPPWPRRFRPPSSAPPCPAGGPFLHSGAVRPLGPPVFPVPVLPCFPPPLCPPPLLPPPVPVSLAPLPLLSPGCESMTGRSTP